MMNAETANEMKISRVQICQTALGGAGTSFSCIFGCGSFIRIRAEVYSERTTSIIRLYTMQLVVGELPQGAEPCRIPCEVFP